MFEMPDKAVYRMVSHMMWCGELAAAWDQVWYFEEVGMVL